MAMALKILRSCNSGRAARKKKKKIPARNGGNSSDIEEGKEKVFRLFNLRFIYHLLHCQRILANMVVGRESCRPQKAAAQSQTEDFQGRHIFPIAVSKLFRVPGSFVKCWLTPLTYLLHGLPNHLHNANLSLNTFSLRRSLLAHS